MLTKGLDKETEKFLADILAQEETTTDELIKNLIRDRWMLLNQSSVENSVENDERSNVSSASPEAALSAPESQDFRVEQPSGMTANAAKQKNNKNNKQTIAEFIKKKRFC